MRRPKKMSKKSSKVLFSQTARSGQKVSHNKSRDRYIGGTRF